MPQYPRGLRSRKQVTGWKMQVRLLSGAPLQQGDDYVVHYLDRG